MRAPATAGGSEKGSYKFVCLGQSLGKENTLTKLNLQGDRYVKKVILGSIMFLSGAISVALVLAGSMANEWAVNGRFSSWWNIQQYGLMPIIYIFCGLAVIGLAIAIWGVLDKKN